MVRAYDSGFGVQSLMVRAYNLEFWVFGFWFLGLVFGVWGLGFGVWCLWYVSMSVTKQVSSLAASPILQAVGSPQFPPPDFKGLGLASIKSCSI
jgi:hypothetical protein